MVKLSLLVFEICLVLCRARLLANYRLWDSCGEVLYDFTGFQNHARVYTQSTSDMILTDRGLYLSKGQISLPEGLFSLGPVDTTALIAFWYFPVKSSRLITIDREYRLGVDLEIYPKYTLLSYTSDRGTLKHSVLNGMSKSYLESWTLVVFQITLIGHEVNIKMFVEDIIPDVGYNFGTLGIRVEDISLNIGSLHRFEGYLYEIWCLMDSNDIQENYSASKIKYQFNIPGLILEDIANPYKNSIGEECSQSCKDLGLSCYSFDRNVCIPSYNTECKHGWYNIRYPRCISPCPQGCLCNQESDKCISCMLNYTLVDNHCIPKNDYNNPRLLAACNTGEYSCQSGCCPCQAFCDSCIINASNELECLSCATNYYIQYLTSFLCVSNCANEYYKGPSTPLKCEKCISNCLICNDSVSCVKCNLGYFLKGNSCIQDCGSGYYNNVIMSTCDACSAGCISCSSVLCSQCDNNTYNREGMCVAACGSGYYVNSVSRICEKCSNYCQGCSYVSGILTCYECISGSYMKNGLCYTDCGSGYYSNPTTKSCQECNITNCDRCDSNLVCTSCLTGLGLQTISGNLVCEPCPIQTYSSGGEVCLPCTGLCNICSNITACTQCVDHAFIWGAGCRCEFGYIPSNNQCIIDPNFYVYAAFMHLNGNIYLFFNQRLKVIPTASEFTVRIDSITYDSTYFTLFTHDPLTTYGISMNDKSLFNGYIYAYVLIPSSNTFLSEADIPLSTTELQVPINSLYSSAVDCSTIPNCYSCVFNWDNNYSCESCNVGYCRKILYPYTCSSCCDPGFYLPFDNSDCHPCPAICATCSRSGCTSCNSGTYLFNYNCITECGVGYYEDNNTNTCSACVSNCSDCNDISSCNTCVMGYVMSVDKSACLACESGTYYDNGSCFNCPLLCLGCSSSYSCSVCIENAEIRSDGICYCKLGYIYLDNACIFTVFHANANIDTNQNIFLMFDKQLMNAIIPSDIEFTLNSIIYSSSSFSLVETSTKQVYMIIISGISYSGVNSFTLNILSYDTIYAIDQSKLYESSILIYICPIECATCNANACFSCVYGYFLKDNSCIKNCGDGYVGNTDTRECQICSIHCRICGYISINLVCSKCFPNYTLELLEGSYQCVECIAGNYIENDRCLPCPNQCKTCSAVLGCTSCIDKYHLEGGSCIFTYSTIHPTATMPSSDSILLSFDKTLIVPLSSFSIYLIIKDNTYLSPSFELSDISTNQVYNISLNNINIEGLSYITLYFTDTSTIVSEDYSILTESSVTISVPIEIGCPSTCNACSIESGYYLCEECKVDYIKIQDRCIQPIALCEDYNIRDEIIYCIKCKNFSYMFDGVNCECFDTSNQQYNDRCPESCPKGMKIENNLNTCIYESESNASDSTNSTSFEDNTNQDVEEGSESNYSIEEIKQAESVKSAGGVITSVNYASSGVSVASGGSNGWSLISTIQIFSFLPLIDVEVPLFLKEVLKSQKDYFPGYDFFQDINTSHAKPNIKAQEFKYKYSNFIINSGKPSFILTIIVSIHLLSKILIKYTHGDIRVKIESIYNMFYYGIYLRYFIQIYLEILIAAFLQIEYVTLI